MCNYCNPMIPATGLSEKLKNGNVFIYLRCSTDKQEHSIEAQKMHIDKYCEHKELKYEEENVYIDEAKSGWKKKWKQRLLKDLFNKCEKYDTVIVYELTRIGRNMYDTSDFVYQCMEKSMRVICTSNDMIIDDDHPQNQYFAHILGAISQMERKNISDRTKAGLVAARKSGKLIGGEKINVEVIVDGKKEIKEMPRMGMHFKVENSKGYKNKDAIMELIQEKYTIKEIMANVDISRPTILKTLVILENEFKDDKEKLACLENFKDAYTRPRYVPTEEHIKKFEGLLMKNLSMKMIGVKMGNLPMSKIRKIQDHIGLQRCYDLRDRAKQAYNKVTEELKKEEKKLVKEKKKKSKK